MLKFTDTKSGAPRFTFHVNHPGIRSRLIYRGARTEILDYAEQVLGDAFMDGVRSTSLQFALKEHIMPFALRKMGERLAAAAPGLKTSDSVNPFSSNEGHVTEKDNTSAAPASTPKRSTRHTSNYSFWKNLGAKAYLPKG